MQIIERERKEEDRECDGIACTYGSRREFDQSLSATGSRGK